MAGARGSLTTIDRQSGAPPRRKRSARSYDAGAPIALSFGAERIAYEPTRAWAVAAAAAPPASPRPPLDWTPPRPVTAPPPASSFGVWSGVGAPSPPRPGTLLPPRTSVPRFTAEQDEAAAAAFAADIDAITVDVEPGEARAADAGDFLARALAESPRPQPQAPAPDEGDEQIEPWRRGHEVFEQLTYANQFDAGSVDIDLAAAFDVYDRELERERRTRSARLTSFGQPTPTAFDVIEDLAMIEGLSEVEAEREPVAEAAGAESFDVVYDVPLVPQQTGYSCWAAGAAMVVAWRDNMSVDPSAIASATGYWEQYKHGLDAEDTTMFKAWRLVPEPAQTYTVDGFRRLLEQWGPLWVASAEPGPHIRVVSGLSGDGTADGTLVHVLDPWEPGMQTFRLPNAGGRYTETYAQFEAKQATLARSESHLQGIYVAHVDRDRSSR
jgi:hypothetical protein